MSYLRRIEAQIYRTEAFPITPMPIVEKVLDAAKKALKSGKTTPDTEKLNSFLKKHTPGDLMDFARSVVKYFKDGKIDWEEGLGLLQDEYSPKGLGVIPWSFLKRELKYAGDSVQKRLPKAFVTQL